MSSPITLQNPLDYFVSMCPLSIHSLFSPSAKALPKKNQKATMAYVKGYIAGKHDTVVNMAYRGLAICLFLIRDNMLFGNHTVARTGRGPDCPRYTIESSIVATCYLGYIHQRYRPRLTILPVTYQYIFRCQVHFRCPFMLRIACPEHLPPIANFR